MLYQELMKSIDAGETEHTMDLAQQALAQGYPAEAILDKGLIAGMNKVAERFRVDKVMVPEVLLASRAMHAGLSVVEPYLKRPVKRALGKIVLGTVAGDLHDIGITLVKVLIMGTGAQIIDLGVDVTTKKFVSAVVREKADILMMSALLTTTMGVMKEVIDELITQGVRKDLKVIVGGGPITSSFAREIGADYYFESALETSQFLNENLSKIINRKNRN